MYIPSRLKLWSKAHKHEDKEKRSFFFYCASIATVFEALLAVTHMHLFSAVQTHFHTPVHTLV